MKRIVLFQLILLSVNLSGQDPSVTSKESRMAWWREARFGMFIHWGLYSIPAGEWNGEKDHGEWIRTTAHIPLNEYGKLAEQFNPVKFNADEWVKIAKEAGMKYIVLTSKHHDGFCLFDSEFTDFDVMSTPFHRDILQELADACRKQGMKICWYHSIMDWHHPDYLPRRDWEKDRPADSADFNRYFLYLEHQVKEIITNYGDISVLWFDGEWESTWSHEYAQKLCSFIRETDPDIIINNRIDVYRDGMAGISSSQDALGDFGTPEQEIPETGIPGMDWESCMTMNDHWGYNKNDKNWKSYRTLLFNLVDIASKGGNYLLNVGPTSDGVFPPESVERLKAIGSWMKTNGESIYGTAASPFQSSVWGKCTTRKTEDGTRLYLHVFDWPKSGNLMVSNLLNEPVKAYLLADPSRAPLTLAKRTGGIMISLPQLPPDSVNSVIVLDIKGDPRILNNPDFSTRYDAASDKVVVSPGTPIQDPKVNLYYTLDGTLPSDKSSQFTKPVETKLPLNFKAVMYYNGKKFGEAVMISLPVSYGKPVVLKNEPSEKYKASGPAALTDGFTGTLKFSDGHWIGTEGKDFEAVLDLGKKTAIHAAGAGYLISTRSWIFEPVEIKIEYSTDNKEFKPLLDKKINPALWNAADAVRRYSDVFPETNARYIRFILKNRGTCPAGHPGAGGKAWIFVDELTVE